MVQETDFDNVRISKYEGHDLDFDLGLDLPAYRHASLIDLYFCAKFHTSQKNFVNKWANVRTYVHQKTGPDLLG